MNQQDNSETNNESIVIEDLNAQNADEIKGGPINRGGGGDGGDIIVFDIVDS